MVISHKFGFVFVKTPKTAGTSIEVFLSGVCGDQDVLTPIEPYVSPHRARNFQAPGFYNHMSAIEIRKRLDPAIWNSYFKFCVERNPWDKTLSHWHMQRYRAGGTLTLDEYFEQGMARSSMDLYTDEQGQIIVDRVVRYEDLAMELSQVFKPLGLPFDGELGVRAKSEYRTDRRHYRDVLNHAQRDYIAKVFEREVALFGYRY